MNSSLAVDAARMRPRSHSPERVERASSRASSRADAQSSLRRPPKQRPIYIYPGLLRLVRNQAVLLDAQCPALIFRCTECEKSGSKAVEGTIRCEHKDACAICMDCFHNKDLVRKLPCGRHALYHSRCILTWLDSANRCPLCNQTVSQKKVPPKPRARAGGEDGQSRADPADDDLCLQPYEFVQTPPASERRSAPASPPTPSPHSTPVFERSRIPGRSPSRTSSTLSLPGSFRRSLPSGRRALSDKRSSSSVSHGKKRSRTRHYSYIVHDSVRMDVQI